MQLIIQNLEVKIYVV